MILRIPVSLILNFCETIYLVPQVQARLEVNGPFRRHDACFGMRCTQHPMMSAKGSICGHFDKTPWNTDGAWYAARTQFLGFPDIDDQHLSRGGEIIQVIRKDAWDGLVRLDDELL